MGTSLASRIGHPVVCQVEVVVDHAVRGKCSLPYPGHKKGCPNFGKKSICPPKAPMIENLLNLAEPVYLVAVPFDLAGHVLRIGERHPDWTPRQRANLLYWQGSVKKHLAQVARYQAIAKQLSLIVGCPEACGVDMTATCANAGIVLEWPPVNTVWKAVLLGTRVGSNI
jgi:predicted metal-binding protein